MLDGYYTCSDLDECLQLLKDDDNLAVAISRQHALNNPTVAQSDIFCFEENQNIFNYLNSMYIRKDHSHFSEINDITQRAFESGLFKKWAHDSKVKLPRAMDDPALMSVKLEKIYGAIFSYGLVTILSVTSIIVEVLAHPKSRLPNAHLIWVYLDKFVDADRHYLKNFLGKVAK